MSLEWWMVFIWAFLGLLMGLLWYWDHRDWQERYDRLWKEFKWLNTENEMSQHHLKTANDTLWEKNQDVNEYREVLVEASKKDEVVAMYLELDKEMRFYNPLVDGAHDRLVEKYEDTYQAIESYRGGIGGIG